MEKSADGSVTVSHDEDDMQCSEGDRVIIIELRTGAGPTSLAPDVEQHAHTVDQLIHQSVTSFDAEARRQDESELDDVTNSKWLEKHLSKTILPNKHRDLFRPVGRRMITQLKTLKPISDLSTDGMNAAVQNAVGWAIDGFACKYTKLLERSNPGTLSASAQITVLPLDQVPKAGERMIKYPFYTHASGSIIEGASGNSGESCFPQEPEWKQGRPIEATK